jgi:hypothetical protein
MTAVEFLEKEIFRNYHFLLQKLNCEPLEEAINQAKEMERQQLKEMYLKGIENYDPTFNK